MTEDILQIMEKWTSVEMIEDIPHRVPNHKVQAVV